MRESKRQERKLALEAALYDVGFVHAQLITGGAHHANAVVDCGCERGDTARVLAKMIRQYAMPKPVKERAV